MTTLAQQIIHQNISGVEQYLRAGVPINDFDEYGYTPLIETAIVNSVELARLLLEQGADPNMKDVVGGTALHWAVENSNHELAALLLSKGADANAHNNNGEPVLAKPILRADDKLKKLLIEHGATSQFAMDYINTKLLGHYYELRGEVDIVTPQNEFTEVSLEGFFLEFSTGLLLKSLRDFRHNYAARKLDHYFFEFDRIAEAIANAERLAHLQQYQIDRGQYRDEIRRRLQEELLVLPIGCEGHATAIIIYQDTLVTIDRRKEGHRFNGISFYSIGNHLALNEELLNYLLYEKKQQVFLEKELHRILGLRLQAQMLIEPQASGNCSWANLEAVIPAALTLLRPELQTFDQGVLDYDHEAIQVYRVWREWNRRRALDFCLQAFPSADKKRKASIVAILANVVFQRLDARKATDVDLAERIVPILQAKGYEYVLQSWRTYYYIRKKTQAGKNLQQLLRIAGVDMEAL